VRRKSCEREYDPVASKATRGCEMAETPGPDRPMPEGMAGGEDSDEVLREEDVLREGAKLDDRVEEDAGDGDE
jgi:hypothetical protein